MVFGIQVVCENRIRSMFWMSDLLSNNKQTRSVVTGKRKRHCLQFRWWTTSTPACLHSFQINEWYCRAHGIHSCSCGFGVSESKSQYPTSGHFRSWTPVRDQQFVHSCGWILTFDTQCMHSVLQKILFWTDLSFEAGVFSFVKYACSDFYS